MERDEDAGSDLPGCTPGQTPGAPGPIDGVMVLLVEDDPVEVLLLERSLRSGYGATPVQLSVVESLATAVTTLGVDAPDLVLLDLGLPDASGLDALHGVRAANPDVPVVVLTGRDDHDVAVAALRAGAQDYLIKGEVDPDRLLRSIRYALERHRLQTAQLRQVSGLWAIAHDLHADRDVGSLVTRVASHIAGSMQKPSRCTVHVDIDGVQGSSRAATTDGPALHVDITLDGRVRGHIRAQYPAGVEFQLPDERYLLDGVAETLELHLRRQDAVTEIAASEERFRLMAESAGDGIYRIQVQPSLELQYVNPATLAITGFTREDFEDAPELIRDRIHADDLERLEVQAQRGSGERTTVRLHRADGEWICVEKARTVLVEDDHVVVVQGTIRDVTAREGTERALREALEAERAAASELRAASDVRRHLLQVVSHELRTPLTPILGLAATLAEHGGAFTGEQLHSFHHRIRVNAERLAGLLDEMQLADTLDASVLTATRTSVDVGELVGGSVAAMDPGERRVIVQGPPVVAELHAPVVRRLLGKLLDNAVKHTPGDATIDVWWQTHDGTLLLHVGDDGTGVAEDLRDTLFDPFVQGTAMREAASPGLGIGLAVAQRLAVSHGGRILVGDAPDGGALFTVELPLTGPDGFRPARQEAEQVVAWATHELLHAEGLDDVVGIVLRVVHRLGGWTIPARREDENTIPLDLTLGTADPVLPAADAGSEARERLERHLPALLADARTAADRLTQSAHLRSAAGPADTRPRAGDGQELGQGTRERTDGAA